MQKGKEMMRMVRWGDCSVDGDRIRECMHVKWTIKKRMHQRLDYASYM